METNNSMFDYSVLHRDTNMSYRGRQGHGFYFEEANNMANKFMGKDSVIVGRDNAKNGPDRMVQGELIQSKCCKTASESVRSMYDENGKWKYLNPDGTKMPLELTKDQYDEGCQIVIKMGDDPNLLVRNTPFTQNQIRNLTKFGSLESVMFQAGKAVENTLNSAPQIGITAICTYSMYIRNGCTPEEAIEKTAKDCAKNIVVKNVIDYTVRYIPKEFLGLLGDSNMVFQSIKIGWIIITNTYKTLDGTIHGITGIRNVAKAGTSMIGGAVGMKGGSDLAKSLGVKGLGGFAITMIGGAIGGAIGISIGDLLFGYSQDDIEQKRKGLIEKIQLHISEYQVVEKEIQQINFSQITDLINSEHGISFLMEDTEAFLLEIYSIVDPQIIEIIEKRPLIDFSVFDMEMYEHFYNEGRIKAEETIMNEIQNNRNEYQRILDAQLLRLIEV